MRRAILGVIAAIGVWGLSGCADSAGSAGWELSVGSDAAVGVGSEVGVDAAGAERDFRRACITYVGGYNRMAVMGDADGGTACVVFGFIGDGDGRSRYADVELSPGREWSLAGISADPAGCERLSEDAESRDFTPAERASGTIAFTDREDAGYPGQAVTIDVELEFGETGEPAGRVGFSVSDLAIEGECQLLGGDEGG